MPAPEPLPVVPQKPTGAIAPVIDPDARPVRREAVLRNDSLVKVNATYQGYAPHIPWQRESPASRRGLGVILSGNRVLVTAQIVADATYIELELADSGQKLPAKVTWVDYEANLAVLSTAASAERSKSFFDDRLIAVEHELHVLVEFRQYELDPFKHRLRCVVASHCVDGNSHAVSSPNSAATLCRNPNPVFFAAEKRE